MTDHCESCELARKLGIPGRCGVCGTMHKGDERHKFHKLEEVYKHTSWLTHDDLPGYKFRTWNNGRLDVEHIEDPEKEVTPEVIFKLLKILGPYMESAPIGWGR